MTAIDYAARVAKGVALLDEQVPGWVDRINLETLDVESGVACVTAQLSGQAHYVAGMRMLGLTSETYMEHGFNAEACGCCNPDLPAGYDRGAAYATLTQLWREVIEERRKAALAAPEVALAA